MSTRFFLKALTTATIAATNMQIASAQTTNFAGCLAGLEEQANKAGIARHTYRDLTTGLSPDLSILEKLDIVVTCVINTQGSTYSKAGNILVFNSKNEFCGGF